MTIYRNGQKQTDQGGLQQFMEQGAAPSLMLGKKIPLNRFAFMKASQQLSYEGKLDPRRLSLFSFSSSAGVKAQRRAARSRCVSDK